MGIHNRHAEAVSDQHFQSCTFRMPPGRERCHRVAVHQRGDVTAHAVVPGAAVGVGLGGVGDDVAGIAQIAGHGVEGGEI
ncbi:hypothetical protein D3C72_2308680 [compost metagenome]